MIFAHTAAEKEHDGHLVSAKKDITCSNGNRTIPAGTKGRIKDAREILGRGTRILVFWNNPEDGTPWFSFWHSDTDVIECVPEGP